MPRTTCLAAKKLEELTLRSPGKARYTTLTVFCQESIDRCPPIWYNVTTAHIPPKTLLMNEFVVMSLYWPGPQTEVWPEGEK